MTARRRITKIWSFVIAATVITGMSAGSARGAEYFVAPGGSDGNGGTGWNDAFASISNALAQVDVDTVTVSNGTYTIDAQVTVASAVTIRSFGGGIYGGLDNAEATIVQRTGGTSRPWFRIFLISHAGAVLDGLTITGGQGQSSGRGIRMDAAATVRNCIVRDNGDLGSLSSAKAGGGGIYMNGGIVSNCTIKANAILEDSGVGIWAKSNSTIVDCRILDNQKTTTYRSTYGAGIFADGGNILIRNCLVAGNVGEDHGAGIYGGTVENCTVVSNTSFSVTSLGGGVYNSTVVNSVVVDNETGSGSSLNYGGSSTFTYSCSVPLPSGAGNIDFVEFVDAANANYQLRAGPAVDSGSNATWMTNALDLAGNPRLNGAGDVVDMGAYEKVPGALECGFSADATKGNVGDEVVFTALPFGTNTTLTSASWTFGDGEVAEGLVVTNSYTSPGAYTVSLSVVNSVGENASASYPDYIVIWGSYVYVSQDSPSPGAPYHTWSNASHSLLDAVDEAFAGATVVLTNDTHVIAQTLIVDKELTICGFGNGIYGGLDNAALTVVNHGASDGRVLTISHPDVVLDGLTITGGSGKFVQGKGVYMTGGSVFNCIVKENGSSNGAVDGNSRGGGIYMNGGGGIVSNCTIEANQIVEYDGGAGIYAQGDSQILNSRIIDNKHLAGYASSGGGIYASSSSVLIRNCLVAGNVVLNNGGGVYGGTIENCTIVTNMTRSATATGGGVYLTGSSTVKNSIVYFNTVDGVHSNLNTTAGMAYSCFTFPDDTSNGNITGDPLFEDIGAGNYRLTASSPCINAGDSSVVTWPTDLDGNPRIYAGTVDMGAYELFVLPSGTLLLIR